MGWVSAVWCAGFVEMMSFEPRMKTKKIMNGESGDDKNELIALSENKNANGTCVSFCNQPNLPKAHFGLPWVRPWDNRGKCHMDEKRIQCLSKASFPSNSTRKFKSSPF